jgi:hypothetical protein
MVRTIERFEALLRRTWDGFDLPLRVAAPARFGPADALLASARVTEDVRLEVRCARALAERLAASVFSDASAPTEEDLGTLLIHLADALAGCVDRTALAALLSSGVVAAHGELVRRCFLSGEDMIVVALTANPPVRHGRVHDEPRRTG